MHQRERVGLDFIAGAPFRFVSTVDLTITPEQVFEVLDDAESWPHWATVITKVTWTSPQPHGVETVPLRKWGPELSPHRPRLRGRSRLRSQRGSA